MQKSEFSTSDRQKNWLYLLTLIAGTCFLYFPVFSFAFLHYDDHLYIYENIYVQKGLSLSFFTSFLTAKYDLYWIPTTLLSHAIDWQIYSNWAGGHHLTNLLLHILNIVLLFFVFRKMKISSTLAFLIAAIFAWHPVQVEPVAWVTLRTDLLRTFFMLGALHLYLSYIERGKLHFLSYSLILTLLSLTSKPTYVILPLIFFIFDFWPLNRSETFKKRLLEKIPFFILSAIYCIVLKYQNISQSMNARADYPITMSIANIAHAYWEYISLFFYPAKLSILFLHSNEGALIFFPIALTLAALTVFFFLKRASLPFVWAGWCLFGIGLLPVISSTAIGLKWIACRYLYWPLVGLSIMSIWTFKSIIELFPKTLKLISILCLGGLIITSSLYLKSWKNTLAIFTQALSVDPANWRAHIVVAHSLEPLGLYKEAAEHLEKAVQLSPEAIERFSWLDFYCLAQEAWRSDNKNKSIHFLSYAQLKLLEIDAKKESPQYQSLSKCLGSLLLGNNQECGFTK